jgi:hypothetical protein
VVELVEVLKQVEHREDRAVVAEEEMLVLVEDLEYRDKEIMVEMPLRTILMLRVEVVELVMLEHLLLLIKLLDQVEMGLLTLLLLGVLQLLEEVVEEAHTDFLVLQMVLADLEVVVLE